MKLLYFDCFSGASGDMVLGALLDAGLPLDELTAALGPMLPPGARLHADSVVKHGIAATKFRLIEPAHPPAAPAPPVHDAGHAHGHPHARRDHASAAGPHHHHTPAPAHGHRTMVDIHALIDQSSLSAPAKQKAGELFDRLAAVEAGIHRMPVERVHLHEVGALDSIVDIVGAAFAFEWFGADRIVSSPLNVGGGTVETAHGVLPVPAPATLQLLEGVPVYSSGEDGELVTPTGALLLTGHATAFGPMPAMAVERIGYGAGDRELRKQANVLRVAIGRSDPASDSGGEAVPGAERVLVLECEIDDMNPQLFGVLMDRLQGAGALDVFFTPVQMKKNRPGTLVTVLAPPERREAMQAIVFGETTTIGVRWHEAARERLERERVRVETPRGTARVKVARRQGTIVNAVPEFDDCVRLAAEAGISVKDAQALVMQAYLGSRTKA